MFTLEEFTVKNGEGSPHSEWWVYRGEDVLGGFRPGPQGRPIVFAPGKDIRLKVKELREIADRLEGVQR